MTEGDDQDQPYDNDHLGWNATFSMGVGGMIGGGIFSVLGVVVSIAGPWAWASFLLGGLLALATAHSYVRLAASYGEGGGAFTFLRESGHASAAGALSWVLIGGYVLTTAVYAFTFGHYVAHVFGGGGLLARLLAVSVMAALTALNVRGVGDSSSFEVVAVWGKLVVLGALAVAGLARWAPRELSDGVPAGSLSGVVVGAAAVFMAYEGFQLLTYDYDDIEDPDRTLPRAVLPAVVVVIAVYISVTLGAAMLVGAGTLAEDKEIALAAAGEQAAGSFGMVLVSVAAALSAGSAINATLFATARLARRVADDGELPGVLGKRNGHGVPARAVVALGAAGTVLAGLGGLGSLVEAASLTFLLTFAGVNIIAATQLHGGRAPATLGALAAVAAGVVAAGRIADRNPLVLLALAVFVGAAFAARPILLSPRAAD